jgi:hypothetical protein
MFGQINKSSPPTDEATWRWREAWRRALPRGVIIQPLRRYTVLQAFWGQGQSASAPVVWLAYALAASLMAADYLAYSPGLNPAPDALRDLLRRQWLGPIRLAAPALFALAMVFAIERHSRFWRFRGRIDELRLTGLGSEEILPLLWVPPAIRIHSAYGLCLLWRIAWAGQWEALAHGQVREWLRAGAPATNLSLALLEFCLAQGALRAASICSLRASLRAPTSLRAADLALRSALKYLLYATVSGSFALGVLFLAALGLLAWRFFDPDATFGLFTVAAVAILILANHMAVDLIEDYEECETNWPAWQLEIDGQREG